MSEQTQTNSAPEWDIDNLPNRLTLFRVCMIPVITTCLFLNMLQWEALIPYHDTLGWVAAWTFVGASITDFFDGHIARKRGIVTVFGSFLDPIADKFLVVSSLILLQGLGRIHVLLVIVLVLREIYITALRLLAQEKGFSVPVGDMGKWKTAAQMVGIPLLMANGTPWGIPMGLLGDIFIYVASFFSFYSAGQYSYNTLKKLKLARQQARQSKESV